MQALEREQILRLDGGRPVRLTCLFGVLWVTRPGEARDIFLSRGESLCIERPAGVLVSGFTAAVVGVKWAADRSWRERLVARIVRLGGVVRLSGVDRLARAAGMRPANDLR